jgi:hypothetical protein
MATLATTTLTSPSAEQFSHMFTPKSETTFPLQSTHPMTSQLPQLPRAMMLFQFRVVQIPHNPILPPYYTLNRQIKQHHTQHLMLRSFLLSFLKPLFFKHMNTLIMIEIR